LRRKHICHLCGRYFSRRWNKDRHRSSVHQSSHLFPSFSIHDVDYERSMFKYQGSGIYDNPSTNYFNFRLLGNDPVDQSLQILRKLAEVKKLSEYICSTPTRQSVDFIGPPFKTYSNGNTPQRSDYDDLIIVGYNGFMCGRVFSRSPSAYIS
jgi:hypothetical protein